MVGARSLIPLLNVSSCFPTAVSIVSDSLYGVELLRVNIDTAEELHPKTTAWPLRIDNDINPSNQDGCLRDASGLGQISALEVLIQDILLGGDLALEE